MIFGIFYLSFLSCSLFPFFGENFFPVFFVSSFLSSFFNILCLKDFGTYVHYILCSVHNLDLHIGYA